MHYTEIRHRIVLSERGRHCMPSVLETQVADSADGKSGYAAVRDH